MVSNGGIDSLEEDSVCANFAHTYSVEERVKHLEIVCENLTRTVDEIKEQLELANPWFKQVHKCFLRLKYLVKFSLWALLATWLGLGLLGIWGNILHVEV